MRPKLQHCVAILRTFLGLTQEGFAKLTFCAHPTVQAIELGRLNLAESRAQIFSKTTGCSMKWLLTNDISAPIQNLNGDLYTRKDFEAARIAFEAGRRPDSIEGRLVAEGEFVLNCWRLARAFVAACETDEYFRWRVRIGDVLNELDDAFLPERGELRSRIMKAKRSSPKLEAAIAAIESMPHSQIRKSKQGSNELSLTAIQESVKEALEKVYAAAAVNYVRTRRQSRAKKH